MSKKFSSFTEHQLITENFRKFISENETTKNVGGGGEVFTAIDNLIVNLSKEEAKDNTIKDFISDGEKKGFAAGLKYISKNGYKPEKGDYKKIMNDLDDPKSQLMSDIEDKNKPNANETVAWKNGFSVAAYNWDDFMEDGNIKSDRIPSLDDFKNFGKWLENREEREQRQSEDEEALEFDEFNPEVDDDDY